MASALCLAEKIGTHAGERLELGAKVDAPVTDHVCFVDDEQSQSSVAHAFVERRQQTADHAFGTRENNRLAAVAQTPPNCIPLAIRLAAVVRESRRKRPAQSCKDGLRGALLVERKRRRRNDDYRSAARQRPLQRWRQHHRTLAGARWQRDYDRSARRRGENASHRVALASPSVRPNAWAHHLGEHRVRRDLVDGLPSTTRRRIGAVNASA